LKCPEDAAVCLVSARSSKPPNSASRTLFARKELLTWRIGAGTRIQAAWIRIG